MVKHAHICQQTITAIITGESMTTYQELLTDKGGLSFCKKGPTARGTSRLDSLYQQRQARTGATEPCLPTCTQQEGEQKYKSATLLVVSAVQQNSISNWPFDLFFF